MNNIISFAEMVLGSEMFGFGYEFGRPAVFIFNYPIYLYAIIIVTGMSIAIALSAYFFKKRGYDPYDICIYAIVIIPFAILGARLYVFVFPWDGSAIGDWSGFFTDFRNGGLGIYGGVIFGYISGYVVVRAKKQDMRIVADSIMPGLFIAQSIGRWGNFVNQEAYGPVIENPAWQWFPFGVNIHGTWHYATFFYESLGTFIGFVACLFLVRSKHYKLGWLSAFYGIYYGLVRLFVEGLRTDSLYLWIGSTMTDIKISQLVSVVAILLGLFTLSVIYRKELHSLYSRLFKSEYHEVSASRFIVGAISGVSLVIAVVMFVLGGETRFLIGLLFALIALYSFAGVFALVDRLRLYCKKCGKRNEPEEGVITENENLTVKKYVLIAGIAVTGVAWLAFIVSGIVTSVPNQIVLGVALAGVCVALSVMLYGTAVKLNGVKCDLTAREKECRCDCGNVYKVKLNKFLLFLFPYKVYRDFGVENLKEYVDPEAEERKRKKAEKKAAKADKNAKID